MGELRGKPRTLMQKILEKPKHCEWRRLNVQPSRELLSQIAKISENSAVPVTKEDVFGTFFLSVTPYVLCLGEFISITIAWQEVKT